MAQSVAVSLENAHEQHRQLIPNLSTPSENNEESKAYLIMEQSVANGWKGFFEITESKKKGAGEIPSDAYMENLKSRLHIWIF